MTAPSPLDYLKFCMAEGKSAIEYVTDRLGQFDAKYPPTEAEIEMLHSILAGLRSVLVQSAATFCRDDREMNTYSDGRRIETELEIERGNIFRYRWHPQPDHGDNQPHTVLERHQCTSGTRRSVVVSGAGVLDTIEHHPHLHVVTETERD